MMDDGIASFNKFTQSVYSRVIIRNFLVLA